MTYATLPSEAILNARDLKEIETIGCHPRRRQRRGLVLTEEGARHPFRATLPPHVKADLYDIDEETPAESLWRLTAEDVRGFASTYVAVTAAVLVFII